MICLNVSLDETLCDFYMCFNNSVAFVVLQYVDATYIRVFTRQESSLGGDCSELTSIP